LPNLLPEHRHVCVPIQHLSAPGPSAVAPHGCTLSQLDISYLSARPPTFGSCIKRSHRLRQYPHVQCLTLVSLWAVESSWPQLPPLHVTCLPVVQVQARHGLKNALVMPMAKPCCP
jgi:hypothetical protein